MADEQVKISIADFLLRQRRAIDGLMAQYEQVIEAQNEQLRIANEKQAEEKPQVAEAKT
jgi:hypothetical protein